jgi:tetratricopeptide (TPR) repeat protein
VIRMPEESTLFQEEYEEDAGHLQAWRAALVRRVATAIRTNVAPEEERRLARRSRVVDPEAEALYLRGKVFVGEGRREALEQGIEALERVVAKDPQHAEAWAAMSLGWFGLSSIYVAPREAMPKAKAAALKAVEIDPELDEAHAMLGLIDVFYEWNWDDAAKHFGRALELNPNSFTATRGLVMLNTANGDLEQAALHAQRALQLDPMSVWASFQETLSLAFVRKYEQAEQSASRALAWEPNFGLLRSAKGISQVMRGDLGGVAELEKAVTTQRVPTTLAFLAHGYEAAGRKADGNRLVDELVTMAGDHYVCPFEVAQAMVSLNRIDEAFQWMQKGVQHRADCMIALRSEPWLEPMRSDPRYPALVRAVGFRTSL